MKKPNHLYAVSISLLLSIATLSIWVSHRSIARNNQHTHTQHTATTTGVVSRQQRQLPPSARQQVSHEAFHNKVPLVRVNRPVDAGPAKKDDNRSGVTTDTAAVVHPLTMRIVRGQQNNDHDERNREKREAAEKQALENAAKSVDPFLVARKNYGPTSKGAPAIPVGILTDKPYSFFQKLQNDMDESDPTERCRRYKGTYNPNRHRRIFYGALAASEPWELVEIVSTESHGIFAGVVLVESNRTQNFTPRPFLRLGQEPTLRLLFGTEHVVVVPYVNENASEELLHAIASGISNQVEIDNHYLAREHMQRGEIVRAWRALGMTGDDVGLLVDLDEMLTRDFLRAIQQCDGIEALHYERHYCDHRKVKLVTVTHTFETSPECITADRRGFHPDLLIGACIEGIGNRSRHPVAPREEETFLRKPGFGGGDCDWSKVRSISKQGFFPLWDMSDFRRTCGGGMLGIDTETFPAYAEYSAYHFHNFFTDFNATRFKMATYGHPKAYAMTRGLEFLSNDLKMMYRCVKGIPDAKKQKWKRVIGGFRAVKPFMPIYFQDPDYRRRRHALVQELVELDELYLKRLKEQETIK